MQLKRYTKFYFEEVVRLKSPYTVRLWTMLMQYALIGERTVTLETLYEIFRVPPSYTFYGTFKRRVLEPAKKECEETSLRFDYEEIKSGRAVSALKFVISVVDVEELSAPEARSSTTLNSPTGVVVEDALEHDMVHVFQLDGSVVAQIMLTYERPYLQEKLALAKRRQREGKLTNPPGYLLAAIKNDYQNYNQQAAARKERSKTAHERAQESVLEQAQTEAYEAYQQVLDRELAVTLQGHPLTDVLAAFENYLEQEERFYLAQAKREVTDRGEAFDLTRHYRLPILYGVFRRFMARTHLPPHYHSFEAWQAYETSA